MATPPKRATYQDVLDAPDHEVAEIVDGELFLSSRPRGGHSVVSSALGDELGPPLSRWSGRLDHPRRARAPPRRRHLRSRSRRLASGDDAGRRARRGVHPDRSGLDLRGAVAEHGAPRSRPQATDVRRGRRFACVVDPSDSSDPRGPAPLHEGRWLTLAVHRDDQRVRAEPFEAIELDLAVLWADIVVPPIRASESHAAYDVG